ncbi:MAG: lipase family protein, partial [Pseudomonadota bacterium]
MAITPLTPPESSRIADAVYAGLQADDIGEFRELAATRLPPGFTPGGSLIQARTGTSRTSNFAVVLDRGSTGEKVVTIRGTEFTSKQDWMTNVNIGMIPGPTGFPVHGGFGFTYNSMRDKIRAGVAGTTTVHVCGHSLGGALATLCAADLQARGHTCYLYTYGAPRPAPTPFTAQLSLRLKGRIYRVHDRGDPVPMIPLFPFVHAPLFGSSYLVGPNRGSISADHHAMDKSYIVSADKAGTWNAMRTAFDDSRLQFGPAYWLERAGEATRIPGAGWGLWALGKALEAILKVIGVGLQALIGTP